MKDMRDNNDGGTVYGFITMGDDWRMATCDGSFQISGRMGLIFDTMHNDKEKWLKNNYILVDCLNVALNYGQHGLKVNTDP